MIKLLDRLLGRNGAEEIAPAAAVPAPVAEVAEHQIRARNRLIIERMSRRNRRRDLTS